MTPQDRALVAESRRRQGLPEYIEDPAALRRISDLILNESPVEGEGVASDAA